MAAVSDPTKPPCTSVSNCLVVDTDSEGMVMLHFSRRPGRWIIGDPDEWAAHLAEVRAAALTEAADLLRSRAANILRSHPDSSLVGVSVGGIQSAADFLASLVETAAPPPSATETAGDAPPVPEQAPEPQGPAQTPEGFEDHPLTVRLGRWWCGCGGWIASTDGREAMIDHAVHVHVALGLAVEDDEPPTPMAALAEPHATIAKLAEDLDTARAAAEGFRDELNRTGEQLLAMTADRDEYRRSVLVYADAITALTAERDQLAETLRGADPFAPDAALTRLAVWIAERWPGRTLVADEAGQGIVALAIEVMADLCGQLAECHAELARTRPVVEAAVAWRASGLMDAEDADATLSVAVNTYSAGTPQPDGMVGDTRVAWVPQIPTPDGLPPVLGDDHG